MYIFGHLGLGAVIGDAISKDLSSKTPWSHSRKTELFLFLMIGCLLPDLIDKPLHFLSIKINSKTIFFAGDRSITHTVMIIAIFFGFSISTGSLRLKMLAIGVFSHLLLDVVGDTSHWIWFRTDAYPTPPFYWSSPKLQTYFWPFVTQDFPSSSQVSVTDYWRGLLSPPLIAWEVVGAAFLARKALALSRSRQLEGPR